jgi:Phage integrase family
MLRARSGGGSPILAPVRPTDPSEEPFFIHTMQRDWKVFDLLRVNKPRMLPVILSQGEVRAVLRAVRHPVRRMALTTIYALGLRLGEGLSLEAGHIDGERLVVWVRDGKGAKDRGVPAVRARTPALSLAPASRLSSVWTRHDDAVARPAARAALAGALLPRRLHAPRRIAAVRALAPDGALAGARSGGVRVAGASVRRSALPRRADRRTRGAAHLDAHARMASPRPPARTGRRSRTRRPHLARGTAQGAPATSSRYVRSPSSFEGAFFTSPRQGRPARSQAHVCAGPESHHHRCPSVPPTLPVCSHEPPADPRSPLHTPPSHQDRRAFAGVKSPSTCCCLPGGFVQPAF